jgi:hypothetical protein
MDRVERLFTPQEANALLPSVEPLVGRMRESALALAETRPALEGLAERAAGAGGTRPTAAERSARDRFAAAQLTLVETLRELSELGVWVKDAERGLIDFPCLRDGEVVELCWLHGEPAVAHWHHVGEGFAGRRPLD